MLLYRDMIDKYDLQQVIKEYMPELKTIDKDSLFGLIESMNDINTRKIQVWAVADDTVPLSLGVFEDITDFRVPIKMFKEDVTIEFEDEMV